MSSFDVIIIGRGITGLSAAWHLGNQGLRNIAMIGPNRNMAKLSSSITDFASISLHDNISRIVHHRGTDAACALLRLSCAGYCDLSGFLSDRKIAKFSGEVLRYAESQHELTEMKIAAEWLSTHGLPSTLNTGGKQSIQFDGCQSSSIDLATALQSLEDEVHGQVIADSVTKIQADSSCLCVTTAGGSKLYAEMVVLGNHLGMKQMIPEFNDILVSYADQAIEFQIVKGKIPLGLGSLVFANHSQFWAHLNGEGTIIAGGARYLRKWAGVEATEFRVEEFVTKAVKLKFESLWDVELKPIGAHGRLDVRICDELPLIGPMYGDSRILVATGYMGAGVSLGFAAGKALAQFVETGSSKMVPRIFHPSRHRSLADTFQD